MAEEVLYNTINKKLIEYIMRFPFPYMDILQEQIAACQMTNECYFDCYKIHFHREEDTRKMPLWLPTVPQSCHVLKENGPLLCLLYIEKGYIVQFEVIDMGMNEIDWEYLWSHQPIYEIEYDVSKIRSYLTTERPKISKIHIGQRYVYLKVGTDDRSHTICLGDCDNLSQDILLAAYNCDVDICVSVKSNYRYLVKFDGKHAFECSLVSLQDSGVR